MDIRLNSLTDTKAFGSAIAKVIRSYGPKECPISAIYLFGGLGAGEIARLFGTTAEAVRLTNCRARKEIKKFLEEAGYDLP